MNEEGINEEDIKEKDMKEKDIRGEDVREEVIKEQVRKEEDIIKETWSSMSFGKKLEYLWMYYKSWLFAAVILAGVICLGVSMYKGMHTKILLNAVVIGGDSQKAEWLEESFARYAGFEEKDGVVRVRANIPDDKGGATLLSEKFFHVQKSVLDGVLLENTLGTYQHVHRICSH